MSRRKQAAIELLRRRRARGALLDFAQAVEPSYRRAPHLEALADKLEAVERGEIKRLIVSMPPRHGKTMSISVLFAAWCLGRDPSRRVVDASYAASLSVKNSRDARSYFDSEAFRAIFPEARPDNSAKAVSTANEWETSARGSYYAVGVGGGLTGRGGNVLIIDDPFKDRADAESPTIRRKVTDWYRSTLYTRLAPGGAIILVMTRWHPDDLAGRLLQQMRDGGDKWDVLELPAIIHEGEDDERALWPEQYPLDTLKSIRTAVGRYEWSALYQQRPTVRGGNLFKTDRVRVEPAEDFPSDIHCRYVRFWDLASTQKEVSKDDPDYTVGALVGVIWDGSMPVVWIKDLTYGQWEAPQRNRMILAAAEHDGDKVEIGIESVAGYKDAYTTIKDALKGMRSVRKVTVSKDKVIRASPLEPVFEAGNIVIADAAWKPFFLDQFSEFPAGAHDDAVDAVSGAFEMLPKRGGAVPVLTGGARMTTGGW